MSHYAATMIRATVDDLAWFAGSWRGAKGEDVIEEQWSGVAGGTMMAMFRWLKDDAVRFYELITLEPEEDGVLMRIKHFSPGLIGWEEKDQSVVFVLVQAEARKAVFSRRGYEEQLWLVYERPSPHELIVYFDKGEGEPPLEEQFLYTQLSVWKHQI
jgi:hypothetical protein